MSTQAKMICCRLLFCLCLTLTLTIGRSQAAQQFQGLCAQVKIEILQELALERIGFLATLKITNNEVDASITNFSAALTFEPVIGTDTGTSNDVSDLFFVQPPELDGIASIDGSGIIPPAQTAMISWFIIPKISAGGTSASGVRYKIGAKLAGAIYGQEISQDVLRVWPDTIIVKPEPQLEITYFQPRDVDGDDPFTLDVESPIPFTLGVLVKNAGYGPARQVRIASQQPRIVENQQGLLLIAQLLGVRVDDQPTNEKSLTLNLGDIEPGRCRKGAWDMITSLSGEFVEFKASYTHASELGGRDTSIIKELNAYFIVHEVLNDQPGRDTLLDFLADTVNNNDLIPDTLYESDCNVLPVNHLQDVTVVAEGVRTRVLANADFENWVYIRVDDPAQAKFPIASVVRSDGKVLNTHNYWTNIRYERGTNAKLTFLNIFDFVALGQYEYTVTYTAPDVDTVAPETRLRFVGHVQETNSKFYILPDTQIFFTAEDASPVSIFYRLDGAPAAPAYPFTITAAGEHTIEYYAIDAAHNEEVHHTATVVVSTAYPAIVNLSSDTGEIFISGDALSVRPTEVAISFEGVVTAIGLDAEVEVFRGVAGWPTVQGVPWSPTTRTEATLTVGGDNVAFYRYRLGSEAWSQEFPVSTPLVLAGLNPGTVQVSVNGRSQYGAFLADQDAVTVSWVVDPAAPPTAITGAPATPSRFTDALLTVAGVEQYRFTIDAGFYRAATPVATPIALTGLREGEHVVAVIGRQGSDPWQDENNATSVRWTIDRSYGLRFPGTARVRHEALGAVGAGPVSYVWDGRDDQGVVVPPGWYTVKLTVHDALGRSTSAIKLVRVGNLLADGMLLANAGNANQKEAYAFGKWVVWQDQRAGNWDILALDLTDPTATPVAITTDLRNQERPRTDGRYVVWEDRQADGTWDVWAQELGTVAPAFAVTATPALDERKPVVFWPWVVYQTRPVANPNAPWQLLAHNLLTGVTSALDPTAQDQIDAAIHRQRLVWQDFRDVGPGEIYFKDLQTGVIRRITDHPTGQYYPVIFDDWIVWADNRAVQLDLYGYNLARGVEIQLTHTPENETRPYLNGKWVVYQEDAAGVLSTNLRLLYLTNLASIQMTNVASNKEKPGHASGKLIWVEQNAGRSQVMIGPLPDLQPVFNNQNTVAVTAGMALYQRDAHTLLRLWHEQVGVSAITRYTSLLPTPVDKTVIWDGQPVGENFTLEAGNFLWVKFDTTKILDLGLGGCNVLYVPTGINVLSYACFPDHYSAYQLIREIGVDNVNAIRILDADTGRWSAASVVGGKIIGEDFRIPPIAVVMIDTKTTLGPWQPGR